MRRSSFHFISVIAVGGAAYLVYAGIMFSVACNFASTILECNSALCVCQDPAIGEISPLTQLSNLLNSAFYAGPVIASCVRHEEGDGVHAVSVST